VGELVGTPKCYAAVVAPVNRFLQATTACQRLSVQHRRSIGPEARFPNSDKMPLVTARTLIRWDPPVRHQDGGRCGHPVRTPVVRIADWGRQEQDVNERAAEGRFYQLRIRG
jgi:hypothetical protein